MLLFVKPMRYFLIFLILGGVYWFGFHNSHTGAVVQTITQPEIAGTQPPAHPASTTSPNNFIKRPLDRTHDVLNQVRKGRDENSF